MAFHGFFFCLFYFKDALQTCFKTLSEIISEHRETTPLRQLNVETAFWCRTLKGQSSKTQFLAAKDFKRWLSRRTMALSPSLDFCALLSPHLGTCIPGLLTTGHLATAATASSRAPAPYDAREWELVHTHWI